MLGSIILILLILAVLSGGLIALFAGRRFYPIWLGFATYFFVSRILDLALFRYPDEVRNWGGLIAALLVVAVVLIYRDRVVRFVPPVGGFIVSATIAERLLKYIAPEAGKYLFIFILLAGGLIGFYLFQRLLNFDTAVIVLSALWGASYVSTVVFDFVDVFLISANGLLGSVFSGFLDSTQMLQTLIWLGLAVLGVFVQRKLEYKPIPVIEKASPGTSEDESRPGRRKGGIIWGVIGGLLVIFLVAAIVAGNEQLSKSIRTTITNIERSLGLEAEAPGDAPWEWGITLLRPRLELAADDCVLVLVPHPDDDILSAAGTIQQIVEMGLPIKVVYLTNGDYNETSYALYRKEVSISQADALRLGEIRREEALAAQGILGVQPEQVAFLGYPDGGGLEIFEKHWGESQPYRALLSGQTVVPYTFTQSPDSPYLGESIVSDLERVVRDFQPTKIITSHPGDVHPDHQTLPLYLQIALWNLAGEIDPEVYHFITHYGRWPQPRGYQPEHPNEPPAQFDVDNRWRILPITPEQRDKKLQALQAHKTQWGSGQAYLESLVRANELFDVVEEIPIPSGEEVQILPAEAAFNGEALHLLPESEQNKFSEHEMRSVKLDGDEIVFAIESQQPLAGDVYAKIWAMGYREDLPFEKMPKIYMDISSNGIKLYDMGKILPVDSVTVSGSPTQAEVRVPLALLGQPEKLLVSAQTLAGDIPLDNIPWVYLVLEDQ